MMNPAPPKIHFPDIFDKTSPVTATAPVCPQASLRTSKPAVPMAGREVAPPAMAIEAPSSRKAAEKAAKSGNRLVESGKSFGISIEGPKSMTSTAPLAGGSMSAMIAKNEANIPQVPKPDELRPLTTEEVENHMIYLPPIGAISQMNATEVDELNTRLKEKSVNEKIYDSQYAHAINFFKKVFLIGNQRCSIIEIEFYFGGDPYLFSDFQLFQPYRFYLRRRAPKETDDPAKIQPHGSVFRYGKKRGICVTMGHEQSECAILIRSIVTPKGVVEGSAAVIDFIVESLGVKTIEELNRGLIGMFEMIARQNPELKLELGRGLVPVHLPALGLALIDVDPKECHYQGERIYHGPRVGLHLKKETEYYGRYSNCLMKPYRFAYRPDLLKTAKHLMALTARLRETPDFTIQDEFKITGELLGRWSSYFTRGETASIDILMEPGNLKLDDVKKQCIAYGFFSRFNK